MKKNWGDIDILAVKIKDNKLAGFIVGEVKGEYKTEKEKAQINQEKFENRYVKKALVELFGSTSCKKYLYCWNWESHRRTYAEKLGIAAVSFEEITDHMLDSLAKKEGCFYLID